MHQCRLTLIRGLTGFLIFSTVGLTRIAQEFPRSQAQEFILSLNYKIITEILHAI